MKKLLSVVLTLALMLTVLPFGLFTIPAFAEETATSGITGGCTWTLDGTVLTISGNGMMDHYDAWDNIAPWGCDVTEAIIEDGVTSIGGYAFQGCANLTSVTIPDSVTIIREHAFQGCTGLTSITIPDSVTSIDGYAFSGCKGITSVNIPDSVTSIGNSAFEGCTGLTSVNIPDSVTSIGSSAFEGCTGLTSVNIPDSVTSIGAYTFSSCTGLTSITIPNSVTSIGNVAFGGCTSLKSVAISNSVTSIDDCTFEDCTSLKSVNIPDSVTSIGNSAFNGCTSLTSITIGENVKEIGNYAFYSCTGLTSITIPDSVTSIGNSAFAECTSLESLNLSNNLTSLSNYIFENCYSLENITIPDSVINIDEGAFAYCEKLTNINIPESVTIISERVFQGCESLTSVKMGNNVTEIHNNAFSGCASLCDIKLPKTLTKLEYKAFADTAISSIEIPKSLVNCTADEYIDYYYFNDIRYDILAGPFLRCENLKTVTFEEGITAIIPHLFRGCVGLENIVIPDSVTTIGECAFTSCVRLNNVTMGKNVTEIDINAFGDCVSLNTVTIPENVTIISERVFQGCKSLTSVKMGNNVTEIHNNAFSGCVSLCDIKLPKTLTKLEYKAFADTAISSIEIPKSLVNCTADEYIDYYYFNDIRYDIIAGPFLRCENLKTVTFEEGITAIIPHLFRGCVGLENIVIPDSVTTIGECAFTSCVRLNNVTMGKNVTEIDINAFGDCVSLNTVTIPENVTIISERVFQGCESLTSVKMGNNVTEIHNNAFSGCVSLCDIKLPKTLTKLEYKAFEDTAISSIEIPKSLVNCTAGEYIDYYYFNDIRYDILAGPFLRCENLKTVTFEEGITAIIPHLFRGCVGLENIVIPDSVTLIGESAFESCLRLNNVTMGKNVTVIGINAFKDCISLGEVFYRLDETNYLNIKVDSQDEHFINATWHYNSCIGAAEHTYDNEQDTNCNVCDDVREVEAPHEHVYGEWIVTQEATNDATGSQYKECECGDKITMVIPRKIKFAGASLTLESNVAINYKVKPEYFDIDGYDEIYLVVSFNGEEYTLRDPQYIIDEDRWVFSFKEVSGQMMTDVANATLYGVYQGEVFEGNSAEYSAVAYAKTMLPKNTTTTRVKRLIVDLLNYGTAAQYYTSHNVKNLANAWLSTAQKALGTQTDRATTTHQNLKYKVISNPTVSWKGAGLKLEAAITVRYTIQADDLTDLKAVLQIDGESFEVPSSEFVLVEGTTNRYYIYFDGVAASQMSEPILATIQKGNKAVSNTVQYSIESYIHTNKGTSDAKLSNLLQKMLRYGDSAFSYAYPTGKK